jgi:gephyrin
MKQTSKMSSDRGASEAILTGSSPQVGPDSVCGTGPPRSVEVQLLLQSRSNVVVVTLQAIRPILEREAPGLVHLLLSTSLTHTPLAALSRPIAGTIGNTLILTLPGSVKAVRENLVILLSSGVVEHAIDLIQGGSGEIVHSALTSGLDLVLPHAAPLPAESTEARPDRHHGGHPHHHHDSSRHVPRPRTALAHDPSVSGKSMFNLSRSVL